MVEDLFFDESGILERFSIWAVLGRRVHHGVTMFYRCGHCLVAFLAILASGCGRSPVEQIGAEVTLVPQISEEVRGKLLEGAINYSGQAGNI